DIAMGTDGVVIAAEDGRLVEAETVILASGADLDPFLAMAGMSLPIETSYGQVSHVPAAGDLPGGVSFGGYLTPAMDGFHDLGATFTRKKQDAETGHSHNLGLLPDDWRHWMKASATKEMGSRIRRRAALPDRRPLAGCLGARLAILGGLGARGFTLAPLLGDMLAAEILGHAAPLDRAQRQGVSPLRYSSEPG
ncbi:MAG: FAD-dependent oxidoreductase, partial [Pseudomonadota bacterium]|nr:FAD-dependent oxidoreductase [Pseudomonadota bacterium]